MIEIWRFMGTVAIAIRCHHMAGKISEIPEVNGGFKGNISNKWRIFYCHV